jgi:hypothetical protein
MRRTRKKRRLAFFEVSFSPFFGTYLIGGEKISAFGEQDGSIEGENDAKKFLEVIKSPFFDTYLLAGENIGGFPRDRRLFTEWRMAWAI